MRVVGGQDRNAARGSNPAMIAAFSSAMAATELKNSRCAVSTVVITAAWGRTSLESGAISPGWFMPSSNTPKLRVDAGMRARRQRHAPVIVEVALGGVGGACTASASLSASLVPVLPTLPVTAMILASVRLRAARAQDLPAPQTYP